MAKDDADEDKGINRAIAKLFDLCPDIRDVVPGLNRKILPGLCALGMDLFKFSEDLTSLVVLQETRNLVRIVFG
ncbi:MAG: hypothetical protein ABS96_03400 [Lysobacteraceae bacterium SCN 69-123]|nr:MAG: hypothetical protein ABS96_03400 [Xanthomonadaceae bacterium SCN 69-123]